MRRVLQSTPHRSVRRADFAQIQYPADRKDLFLIPGVEITSANGHILGLFLDAPIDFAALGKFPPPAQAIAAIHASGGLAVLAHPFAPQKLAPEEIARLGFDAI